MVVAIALEGYGPLTVAAARTGLGALAMIALLVALRRPWPTRQTLPALVPIGLLSTAIPFSLLAWGQQHVPSAFAGLSMAVLPLFVLPLAHVFSDERLNWRSLLGVTVGFCGALVLIGPGLAQLGTGAEPLGQLACLTASFCYACASILTRRFPPIDPVAMAAVSLLVGAIALVPIMLVVDGVPVWTGGITSWAILFLGLVPTAFAALLRITVIRSAGSVFMTLVNYQVPLWSVVFGWLVLSEDLPWRFFAALALILIGLAISQWAGLRKILGR